MTGAIVHLSTEELEGRFRGGRGGNRAHAFSGDLASRAGPHGRGDRGGHGDFRALGEQAGRTL